MKKKKEKHLVQIIYLEKKKIIISLQNYKIQTKFISNNKCIETFKICEEYEGDNIKQNIYESIIPTYEKDNLYFQIIVINVFMKIKNVLEKKMYYALN